MIKMFAKISIKEQKKFKTLILGGVTTSSSLKDSVKDIRFSWCKHKIFNYLVLLFFFFSLSH